MQLSHSRPITAVRFDEPNLVSSSGLVSVMALADKVGLADLAQKWLSVPTGKGSDAGGKVTALVAGMVAGADCNDDMSILRHGAMRKLFSGCYAPSTLGSFLRAFTFGHVRQLDTAASRTLASLSATTPIVSGIEGRAIGWTDNCCTPPPSRIPTLTICRSPTTSPALSGLPGRRGCAAGPAMCAASCLRFRII